MNNLEACMAVRLFIILRRACVLPQDRVRVIKPQSERGMKAGAFSDVFLGDHYGMTALHVAAKLAN